MTGLPMDIALAQHRARVADEARARSIHDEEVNVMRERVYTPDAERRAIIADRIDRAGLNRNRCPVCGVPMRRHAEEGHGVEWTPNDYADGWTAGTWAVRNLPADVLAERDGWPTLGDIADHSLEWTAAYRAAILSTKGA